MRTIFISANDTGSGKTYVTAALATHLLLRGQSVQVVKPVETGVDAATPVAQTDTGFVGAFVRRHACAHARALHTVRLQHFSRPLAPVDAALHDGRTLCFDTLVAALEALRQDADWRLVEGAGGLAVPLESDAGNTVCGSQTVASVPVRSPCRPRDWADFALAIHAEATVLVVTERLGAINQARLLAAYARARNLPQPGLWLNQVWHDTPADVRASNAHALRGGTLAVPLWAIHNHGEPWPHTVNAPWLK